MKSWLGRMLAYQFPLLERLAQDISRDSVHEPAKRYSGMKATLVVAGICTATERSGRLGKLRRAGLVILLHLTTTTRIVVFVVVVMAV